MGIPFQLKDAHLGAVSDEQDSDLSAIFSSCSVLNAISAFSRDSLSTGTVSSSLGGVSAITVSKS